ncbi:hypothetical protein [uncultured Tenacibaculum sp.]|uniref:hypothetical protein n=1 Tax=uncultured Tenacibaculum sp. TaxID=174713 RepID=UPI0026394BEC|nr:hypothetical protein [uncultured Tenacibaculum sp.]
MLKIKKIILVLLVIPVYTYAQEFKDPNKRIIDSLAKLQIHYLAHGKITEYFKIYSSNLTDLGGGSGEGKVDLKEWKEKLEKIVRSEQFNNIKGKTVEEILDLEKLTIWNYQELVKEKGPIKRFSYESKEGDYLVLLPFRKEVESHTWFGIFRKENGEWKIVAGD